MADLDAVSRKDILVSIIVPAYNVEKYIEKCITSILDQSHKHVEVIAVDDGSADHTGAILDEIRKRDERLKVLHKDNAGVSAARNSGIDISTGEYIVFVDGDDYLATDHIEYMLGLAQSTGAEFCLSECAYTAKGEGQTPKEYVRSLSPEEATALLLSPKVIVGCWNKIFKRSMLDRCGLRFSTSLFYGEGLFFITTAAQVSNCVGVGNRKSYYYRRNNEMSATTKFNITKMHNGEKALKTVGEQLIVKSRKIDTMLTLHLCIFCLGAVTKLKANHLEKKYPEDYRRWKAYVRKHTFQMVRSKDVSLYRKLLLIGGCISPWLMAKLDATRRKRIAANSVEDGQ